MKKIIVTLLLAIVALAACEELVQTQELPDQSDYMDPDNMWIYWRDGIEIDRTGIVRDCDLYGKTANRPSVCPQGRELFQEWCVIKCPATFTRIAPCACRSPSGELFDDCATYGDARAIGMPDGPICKETEDEFTGFCHSPKCEENQIRFDGCSCARYRRVKKIE